MGSVGGWVFVLDVTLVGSVGNFILLPHIAIIPSIANRWIHFKAG